MENWLPVVGFEGVYEVSDLGSVRRCGSTNILIGDRPKGYVRVKLFNGQKKRRVQAHCLVMEAFVGPVPILHEVNHENGIHDDNRLENLKYVTRSENQAHKYRVLGHKGRAGSKHHYAKVTEADVLEIRRLRAEGWELKALAEKYQMSNGSISLMAKRLTWRHI